MSQFEKSEIMLKYAELIDHKGFVKKSWTWRDIIEDIGLSAVFDVGWIGGTVLLGGATVTTGGVALVVLGGAALSMVIFSFTKQMDNNLTDLISRLSALDPNEKVAHIIQKWITDLESFKPVMKIPQSSTDIKERANINSQKFSALKQLEMYIQAMIRQWHLNVRPNLTDWGWDAAQAEDALNKTMDTVIQAVLSAKQKAQSVGNIMIKQVNKKVKEEQEQTKQVQEKAKGVVGKGKQKKQRMKSPYILGLQRAINDVNNIINAGAGSIIESGRYDWTTGNGLAGVLSSDWRIANRIAERAKVDIKTVQDIEFMSKNPRLIQKVYRELSQIAIVLKEKDRRDIGIAGRGRQRPRRLSVRE